jgi:hypothetical protein
MGDRYIIPIAMVIFWIPIYLYLVCWSVRIRLYVKKKRLTEHQLLGEVLIYCVALFCGIFYFFMLPKKMIKKSVLPDE